ncbi:hypothetical protein LG943_09735 [Streptomonospora sp. S1-112]|uniref:Uncharacterized protein n=1 Tax=Streptomonospora mangrovi TaxID=2883123 RepID=A0A9X3NJ08_9ACTN|nr:hypothetical protein [Streptomonospora mangrovi]MDA0564607.1 hypothetical protein [Streptomonospora mangrovi]
MNFLKTREVRDIGIASLLVLLGFSLTVYLGFESGAEEQPTRGTSALIAVLSGVFQFMGAARFHAIGKADPTLARASVRRLHKMILRANATRILSEKLAEYSNIPTKHKNALGMISVNLSWIEEGLLDAVDDWREFHGRALREIREDSSSEGDDALEADLD